MAEWWEAAPIVSQAKPQAASQGNWWEAAPLADQPQQQPSQPAAQEQAAAPEGEGFWAGLDRKVSGALRSVREPLQAFNSGFTDAYTLGFQDEIEGVADAAMTGRSYEDSVGDARQRERDRSAQNPILAGAGTVAGAVTSPASQLLLGGRGLASVAGRGALAGGISGGVYGFGEGEGLDNRLLQGAKGAGAGAVIGGAAPVAFAGVARGYSGARNALAERATGRQIAQQTGVSPRAGRLAADVVGMDDPNRMRNALARPDAMLADAGPSTQGALDAAIQAPGEGARTALGRIDARATQAGGRLSSELDRALPGSQPQGRQFSDTARMQGDIRASTAAERSDLYSRAYAQPIDYSGPQGGRLMDEITPRLPSSAVEYANKLMRLRGEQSPQIMARIADDGSVSFTNPPDVRQWDYIKQALDGLAESGDGAGAMGGQTRMGSGYQGLARDIRRNLGEAVPEYDQAVTRAGDIIGEVRAIKTGETLLSARTTRAEAEATLEGMAPEQLSAVKRGLRQSIDDRLAQVRAVATDPNVDAREVSRAYGELSSRAARDKMRLLLGNDWPAVETALDDAGQALGLRARVATNSRTFGRQQFGEMLDDSTSPGALRKGEVLGTARGAWQRITGASPDRVARQRGQIRNELADLLTRPNALSVLDVIEQARTQNALAPDTGALLEYLGRAAAVPGATQGNPMLRNSQGR